MIQVFKGQSLLQLRFDTGLNLAGATALKILYTKPNGQSGEFIVNVTDGTILVYNVGVNDIDMSGTWSFQTYVQIGGKDGYGQIVKQTFTNKLN